MDERICKACGKPIIRRAGEQRTHWLKRQTCNYACRDIAQIGKRWLTFPDRKCVICGSAFNRKKSESTDRYRVRQTCSFSCKQTLVVRNRDAKRTDIPEKWCVVCGVRMEKREREHIASFKARGSCSKECHNAYVSRQKIAYHADIRATPYPPEWTDALKVRIRERDGSACQWCGAVDIGRALDTHHIDYNKDNCVDDNLITLCRTCHVATTFGDRDEWTLRLTAILLDKLAA